MNSLASWIDRPLLDSIVTDLTSVAELSDDFAYLMGQAGSPLQSLSHQDFHRGVVGEAVEGVGHTQAQLQRFRECLQTVSHRFQNSGLLKSASPAEIGAESPEETGDAPRPATPPKRGVSFFVPPQGTLGTRLRAFLEWLQVELPSVRHLFVIDAQGCLASDYEPPAAILAASTVLADASRRAARHLELSSECAMQTEISAEEKLCVITADSPTIGAYSVVLVTAYAFPNGTTERIRLSLLRALNGAV
jgi:hypothetical protein